MYSFDKKDQLLLLFVWFPAHVLCKRGVYSKRKEFTAIGRKVFPFRVDTFAEGRENTFNGVVFLENVLVPSTTINV